MSGRAGFIESLTHPRRPQRPPSEAKSLMSVTSCICLSSRKSQSAFTCFRWLWIFGLFSPAGPIKSQLLELTDLPPGYSHARA